MSSRCVNLDHKLMAAEWAPRLIPGAMRGGNDCKSPGTQLRATSHRFADPGMLIAAKSQINAIASGSISVHRTSPVHSAPAELKIPCGMRNVLIVGASGLGRNIARQLEAHPEMKRRFCGFLDDRKPLRNDIIGRTSDLMQWSRTVFIDEVILATPHDRELTLRVLREAQRLRLDVKMAPDLFGCPAVGEVERIGTIPLISLHQERQPVAELLLKRALDVIGAAAALVLLAPVMLLTAFLIKLDSPGPVLYSAERAGRKGRPFRCFKFRTMVTGADNLKHALRMRNQREGPFFKVADDPRVTRAGRFLRRFSLDELPQFLNVLRGEMSLVGPRPHTLDDFSGYAIEHLRRLDVTPGITGLWQVTSREDPSFQKGLKLDVEYIHGWSLGMDLRILLKTAAVVLRGGGQ